MSGMFLINLNKLFGVNVYIKKTFQVIFFKAKFFVIQKNNVPLPQIS